MPEFDCPTCEEENSVEWEDMPSRACDDMDFKCRHCGQKMVIGWVAEIEVRGIKPVQPLETTK